MFDEQIAQLNAPDSWDRLDALKALMQKIQDGEMEAPTQLNSVNNHIHTTYSFSPYSPTKAVWMAYQAGLQTAGIMDHDSIAGAREFIKAGEIVGMATTIGMELRAKADDTPSTAGGSTTPTRNPSFIWPSTASLTPKSTRWRPSSGPTGRRATCETAP